MRTLAAEAFALSLLALLVAQLTRTLGDKSPLTSISTAQPELPSNVEGWRQWVKSDAPIGTPGEDLFNLYPVARKTARRLRDDNASQQVVGALGGGKSSLKRLVAFELSRLGADKSIRVVELELWPYETPKAAVARVITAVVDVLGQETNVLSIRGIRSQYLAAMTASGGFYSAAASLLRGKNDPYEALEAADELAQALGIRLVVWIEDLERFFDGGVSSERALSGATREREAQRLNPLRALVHGLDRLENISVVTATVSLLSRFDVEKIARYTEELPRLSVSQVGMVLGQFRASMLEAFPNDVNPIPPGESGQLSDLADDDARMLRQAFSGGRNLELSDILLVLPNTPRKLKHSLRLMDDLWRELHGEVDIDDLIALSILRTSSPDLFSVLRDSYVQLVAERVSGSGGGEFWDRVIDDYRGLDAQVLSTFATTIIRRQAGVQRPQGVHQDRYWMRVMRGYNAEDEPLDQPVLKAIGDADVLLICRLLIQGEGSALERFSYLMSREVALDCLPPLIEGLVERRHSTWPSRSPLGFEDPPGLVPLWRIWLEKARSTNAEDAAEFVETAGLRVAEALRTSLPNLALFDKVEYFFLFNNQENQGLFFSGGLPGGVEAVEEIRREAWEALLDVYRGQPMFLLDALRDTPAYTLVRVVWGSQRIDTRDFAPPPFAGWASLAPTIVQAASIDPGVMLVQIALLITRERGTRIERERAVTVYHFDPSLCDALFPVKATLLRIYKDNLPVNRPDHGALAAVFDFVRDWNPPEEADEKDEE